MVIKVDFDLTMTILAHNIYRIFAKELERYSSMSDSRIYEKFIANNGRIIVNNDNIHVEMKKKRELPLLLQVMNRYNNQKYEQFDNKYIRFEGAATS